MIVVYGVEYIESEFGQRSEGFKLFWDAAKAKSQAEKDYRTGNYGDGYLGPVLPLELNEIPFDSLEDDLKSRLEAIKPDPDLISSKKVIGYIWTQNNWRPKFKNKIEIK